MSAAAGLEAALFAWFRDGRASALVDEVYGFAPESFELLGYFSRGSSLRSAVAAQEVCRALLAGRAGEPKKTKGAKTLGDDSTPSGLNPASQEVSAEAANEDISEGAAVHDGLRRAEDRLVEIEVLEEVLAALSPWEHLGHHVRGSALAELALAHVGPIVDLLSETVELKRLGDLLGRIESQVADGKTAERDGREWVEGVTFGADPSDLMASERALLGDPATETLFEVRFLEKKLFQIEWSGGEPFGPARPVREKPRGPVIIAVDTSASMTGTPLALARAAALALVRRALAEGRFAHVLLFGGRGSVAGYTFAPGRAAWDELAGFLAASFGGGTDLAGPIRAALALRKNDSRFAMADIALVSDGIAALPERVFNELSIAKKSGMRLAAMAILRPGRGAGILDVLADPLEKLETAAFSV